MLLSSLHKKLLSMAVVLAPALLVGCATDTKNTFCTPDARNNEQSFECLYGPERKPRYSGVQCDASVETPVDDPTFQEVAEVLIDLDRGGCAANTTCHAPNSSNGGLELPTSELPTDLQGFQAIYDALTESTGLRGVPYVDVDEPTESWMHCNVRKISVGPPVGSPMPKAAEPGLDDADARLIEDWILQGANPPQ